MAGGNFTPCKQEKETAGQSSPEGNSLQPHKKEATFSLSLLPTHTHTHTERKIKSDNSDQVSIKINDSTFKKEECA